MTPKEKASDLVCDFYAIQSNEYNYGIDWEMAKQCALIAVNEIISINNVKPYMISGLILEYYKEVKQEIELL
jgi:hypothetical protein